MWIALEGKTILVWMTRQTSCLQRDLQYGEKVGGSPESCPFCLTALLASSGQYHRSTQSSLSETVRSDLCKCPSRRESNGSVPTNRRMTRA